MFNQCFFYFDFHHTDTLRARAFCFYWRSGDYCVIVCPAICRGSDYILAGHQQFAPVDGTGDRMGNDFVDFQVYTPFRQHAKWVIDEW
jgi:hypothetical protein